MDWLAGGEEAWPEEVESIDAVGDVDFATFTALATWPVSRGTEAPLCSTPPSSWTSVLSASSKLSSSKLSSSNSFSSSSSSSVRIVSLVLVSFSVVNFPTPSFSDDISFAVYTDK